MISLTACALGHLHKRGMAVDISEKLLSEVHRQSLYSTLLDVHYSLPSYFHLTIPTLCIVKPREQDKETVTITVISISLFQIQMGLS